MDLNTPHDTPAETLVAGLVALLDVEEIDTDLYRGQRQPGGVGRVFGGQVIAQGLQAAQRSTEPPKIAHSLHAYFMRPGDEDFPIIYRVVRDFEGKSFANRRVIAMQRGKPILNMTASFHVPEEGLHHQDAMPEVPAPETLASDSELRAMVAGRFDDERRVAWLRTRPVELRSVDPSRLISIAELPPRQQIWFRLRAAIGDDAKIHRAILAYVSDMALLGTGGLPHGVRWMITPGLQSASLDHALWLHEPFRVDDWLLYDCDSPWAGHARSFNRGRIFNRDGQLVASVAQEGLMRLHQ